MLKKKIACFVVGFMVLVVLPVCAQEEKPPEGHVFVVSTFKVQFQNVEKALEILGRTMKPINAANEHVLSYNVFIHLYGSDWAILAIAEYESLSAMDLAEKRGEEIRKETIPDEEWEKSLSEILPLILAHTDDIVKEVPTLRK